MVRVYSHGGGLGVIVRSAGTLAPLHDSPRHLLVRTVNSAGVSFVMDNAQTTTTTHETKEDERITIFRFRPTPEKLYFSLTALHSRIQVGDLCPPKSFLTARRSKRLSKAETSNSTNRHRHERQQQNRHTVPESRGRRRAPPSSRNDNQ